MRYILMMMGRYMSSSFHHKGRKSGWLYWQKIQSMGSLQCTMSYEEIVKVLDMSYILMMMGHYMPNSLNHKERKFVSLYWQKILL